MRAPRTRRTRLPVDPPLLAVLAIAAALRLTAILTVGDMPALHGDEGYYVESARVLASGRDLADTFRPPGYPLFLAAVLRVAGDHLLALRLAQLVAGLVLVALVYDLVRARFGLRAAFLSIGPYAGPISRRTSAAPAARAFSLPSAMSRASGTMPQLVQG